LLLTGQPPTAYHTENVDATRPTWRLNPTDDDRRALLAAIMIALVALTEVDGRAGLSFVAAAPARRLTAAQRAPLPATCGR
jgi:hypothetical protein